MSDICLIISPISLTASILIPALVVATPTEEHTYSVVERASGIDFINFLSDSVYPLYTRAEYPPIKLTPSSFAALSNVFAN